MTKRRLGVMARTVCALCQRAVPLRESHIVPKWAYKRARSPDVQPPDPLEVTDGLLLRSSKQVKEKLLCDACEHRFAVWDEYVAKLAPRTGGDARLLDLITYDARMDEQLVDISKLDVDKLLRFALSVVWRAHASTVIPKVHLGAYAREVTDYLFSNAPFPADVRVRATFFLDSCRSSRPKHLMDRLIVVPQSNKAGGAHVHWFIVGGFHFAAAVGRIPPSEYANYCLHHRRPPRLILQDPHQSWVTKEVIRVMANAKPKGRRLKQIR